MSNKLKEDLKKYDCDTIEDQCYEELLKFDKEYVGNKRNFSLNEKYLKNNYELLVSGKYFIPYPLLVYIDRLNGFRSLTMSDDFVRRNLELYDKEHLWFDGWGMKKICHGINWFFDDVKNFEYILLYTVSKFIE